MRIKNILLISLVSILLTISLVAVFFVGDAVVSLPLPPFDFFSWLTRILPGPMITFGIDRLVDILTLLNFDVADTAKTAEQILSVFLFIILNSGFQVIVGAIGMEKLGNRSLSLIIGFIPAMIFSYLHIILPFTNSENLFISVAWIILAFMVWGFVATGLFEKLLINEETQANDDFAAIMLNRRKVLLRIGGSTAAITLLGSGLSFLLNRQGDEEEAESAFNATDPVAGDSSDRSKPVIGTRSELTPVDSHYLIDINPRPPVIEEENYLLHIHGLVDNELYLPLVDIKNNYETMEEFVTLSCISNPVGGNLIGTTKWKGSSLKQILDEADLKDSARFIELRSIDGYHETISLDLINSDDRIMLCYEWDDRSLTHEHGYPLRVWIPDLYGMKMPRWITEIEVIEEDRQGYWVVRGWDEKAQVKITSVIDTISSPFTDSDGQIYIPLGGVAYSGDRGISKVEIRVDQGDWVQCTLFDPLSENTWVLWRYDLQFIEGNHTFEVRTFDIDGVLQTEQIATPHPSGASGYHRLSGRS